MLKVHNAIYLKSVVKSVDYPESAKDEVLLLGRSNVGKSTFINKFCNRKNLAYTSSKPGKTQTLNFYYLNEDLTFVDVPGYGYAKVSKTQRQQFGEMIEEYLTTREICKFAVLLIDFKVGPTSDDILMYDYLKFINKQTIIIATKKDKVKRSGRAKQEKSILSKLEISETDRFVVYSSEDGNDIIKIHTIFENILGDTND